MSKEAAPGRKWKYVFVGVMLFFLVPIAALLIGMTVNSLRDRLLYGEVFDMAEENGLRIQKINKNGVVLEGLAFTEKIGNESMEKVVRFSEELAMFMNEHKDRFDSDRAFYIKAETDPGCLTTLAVSTEVGEYEFADFYIMFKTSIKELGYLKNARSLHFYSAPDDPEELAGFESLESVYFSVTDMALKEQLEETVHSACPGCKVTVVCIS